MTTPCTTYLLLRETRCGQNEFLYTDSPYKGRNINMSSLSSKLKSHSSRRPYSKPVHSQLYPRRMMCKGLQAESSETPKTWSWKGQFCNFCWIKKNLYPELLSKRQNAGFIKTQKVWASWGKDNVMSDFRATCAAKLLVNASTVHWVFSSSRSLIRPNPAQNFPEHGKISGLFQNQTAAKSSLTSMKTLWRSVLLNMLH